MTSFTYILRIFVTTIFLAAAVVPISQSRQGVTEAVPIGSFFRSIDVSSLASAEARPDYNRTRPTTMLTRTNPVMGASYDQVMGAVAANEKALLPKLQADFMSMSVLDDPQCGNWQSRYRELHKAIMNNTANRQRTVRFLATGNCGGLTDRLLGMVSTFMFALLDDRAFLAHWDNPFMLEDLFDAPSVNWTSTRSEGISNELNWINYEAHQVDSTFVNSEKSWKESFPEAHYTFRANRGMAIRLARSEKYGSRIKEMGLTVDNIIGCTMDYIVKPKPTILQFISKFVGLFRLPSVFSVGIQIRVGDNAMEHPTQDFTSLSTFEHYFTCADKLSQIHAKENQVVVYFFVTDSSNLREEAIKRYSKDSPNGDSNRHLLVSGVPIAHINHAPGIDGTAGSIVEQWAFAETNYRVITDPSGYGKIAAFRSRAQGTTVQMSLSMMRIPETIPDCSKPSALASFESMASKWSLG